MRLLFVFKLQIFLAQTDYALLKALSVGQLVSHLERKERAAKKKEGEKAAARNKHFSKITAKRYFFALEKVSQTI